MIERGVKLLAGLLAAAIVLRLVAWLVTPIIPALLSLLGTVLIAVWIGSMLWPRGGDKK